MACNVTAVVAGPPPGRLLRQPVLHADPPDVHPAVRRVPVEAHADVGVAAQRRPDLGAEERRRRRGRRRRSPRTSATTTSSGSTRASATWRRATSSSRAAKRAVDSGRGVGPLKNGVYLDFADAIGRLGKDVIEERYGNLFEMYERITGENPYDDADAHLPGVALHDGRAVGRLRADDHDPRPVLRRRGQLLRPRRQPPRRVGADAGPGRRLLRAAVHDRQLPRRRCSTSRSRAPTTRRSRRPRRRPATASTATSSIGGTRSPDYFHRELGKIIWDYCGMERTEAGPGEGAVGDPGAVRGVPEGPAGHRQRRRASTRRWRRPAGSTTSSSSAC